MSTRILRSQVSAGVTPSRLPVPIRRTSLPGEEPEKAEGTSRLYSDVLASRSSSPNKESDNISSPAVGQTVQFENTQPVHKESTNESDDSDDSKGKWTTVQRRRAHSLDSPKRGRKILHNNSSKLSSAQKEVVKAATENMTKEQKARVQRRQQVVQSETKEQDEPVIHKDKGKNVDLREWGNIKITEEELIPETQEIMFQKYKAEKDRHDYNREPKLKKKKSKGKKSIEQSLMANLIMIESFRTQNSSDIKV